MPEYDGRTLAEAVGIVKRLGESQRAQSVWCAEGKDFAGCVTYNHGAAICDQIVILLLDMTKD